MNQEQIKKYNEDKACQEWEESSGARRARTTREIAQRNGAAQMLEASGVTEASEGLVAAPAFRARYPWIAADQNLYSAVHEMDKLLIKAGDNRPILERYEDIGERISGVLGESSREQAELLRQFPADLADAAMERKRDKSPSEIVQEMAEKRLQARGRA